MNPYRFLSPRRTTRTLLAGSAVIVTGLLTGLSTACAGPPAGAQWTPVPALTDEFAGDQLDLTKWHNRNPKWKGRPPVYFHPDCVAVHDGMLHLTALDRKASADRNLPHGFTHVSGFLKSKTAIRYGYFEIKARLMDSTLVSAFWLYQHTNDQWTEIDVVEVPAGVDGHRDRVHMNVHVFHSPEFRKAERGHYQDPTTWQAPFDLADDDHVYGLEWTPQIIRWYVDGKVVRTRENTYWHQPLHLNINNESNDWFEARPDDNRLPASYRIQYVRTWKRIDAQP